MKKVTFVFTDNEPPYFEYKHDNISQRGYFRPENGRKIIEEIKNELFSNSYNPKNKKHWSIIPKNVLAVDADNESILIKIPSNIYYIPVIGTANKVFKVELPTIIAAKLGREIYYYWTDEEFNELNINSTVFNLKMPHLYSSNGSLCIGNFKESLDWNNPEKFFVDLLTYPVSHASEIQLLRDMEEKGFDKTHYGAKKIINLIK